MLVLIAYMIFTFKINKCNSYQQRFKNDLSFYIMKLEKAEPMKTKVEKSDGKYKCEINEIVNRKTICK